MGKTPSTFFSPLGDSEEGRKEEEGNGDDNHVDDEINHAVAHDIAETQLGHAQQGDSQKKMAMGLSRQRGTGPFYHQFGTKK